MRQAGIIAAGGVYALFTPCRAPGGGSPERPARGLAKLPRLFLNPEEVETNIILFDVTETGLDAAQFVALVKQKAGIRFSAMGPMLVRAVTHLGISEQDIDETIQAVGDLVRGKTLAYTGITGSHTGAY